MKSIIKWFFIIILTLLLGGVAALLIFKDRIIEQVVVEVNKSLNVPVEIKKVDLDFFHGFPNVSVAFHEVVLPANFDNPFLKAKKLYALIDPIAIARGEIKIEKLEIIDAKLRIIIDEKNNNNLSELFAPQPELSDDVNDSTEAGGNINLKAVLLKNIEIDYKNFYTGTQHHWLVHKVEGDLALAQDVLHSTIKGNLATNNILTRTWELQQNRELEIDLAIGYDIVNKLVTITKSSLHHNGAEFILDGRLILGNNASVDLQVAGNKITFNLLKSFLPSKAANLISEYKSDGIIDFDTSIKGKITSNELPSLVAEINLQDVDLTDESYNANINDLNLSGKLQLADIGDLSSGSFQVTSATGLLQDQPFLLNFSIKNFMQPSYIVQLDGAIATDWLMGVIKLPYADTGKGLINVDINASGKQNSNGEIVDSDLSGSFNFNDLAFQWADTVNIDKIAGTIQLNGDVIGITDLNIEWLQSDLTINGSIEDFLAELSGKESRILLHSDIKSRNLAIEDIVSVVANIPLAGDSTSNKNILLDLQMTCLFNKLNFMRYKGQNETGELMLNNNILEVVNLNANGMGGGMKVDGKLYTLTNKDFYIDARVLTKSVYLDSMFYVFNNFDQTFITDKELKGKLFADVNATMFFDSTWRFRRKLLIADAKLRIVDGELDQFEPLMALSTYIDDKDDNLSNLRFSDLINYITIKDDTIFIPEMSIQTNVRNIAVGGYHTLDQHINYRLAVPIINERVDKDEAFGAVKKSSKGSPNLLFRIKGTTIDYKVNYDLLRATGNVLKLLDLTKIFKKSEVEPVDSTFLNDEVFDW